MSIDWGLLTAPNAGNAFQAGLQNGREMKRQQVVQNALAGYAADPTNPDSVNALIAAEPALGFRLQDRQREEQRLAARRAVFAPQTPATASPQPMGPGMAGVAAQAPGGAPASLVDPAHLPPRTDGLQINQQALRNLYQIDTEGALEIQKMIYNADKAGADRMKASGEVMATAAYRLSQLPPEQRAAELRAMTPQLVGLGLDPQQIAGADLSDASLQRYMTIGRSIKDVMADDAAKYVTVPAGGDLVNIRDPEAVRRFQSGGGSARPTSKAEYDSLAPGATYTAPDGSQRVKGGAPSQGGGNFR